MNNIKIAIVVFALSSITMVLFTNTTPSRTVSLSALKSESRQVSGHLNNPRLSQNAKGILRIHKQRITDAISLVTKSESCAELFQHDPTMITGRYVLYRKNKTRFLHDCLITSGRLSQEAIVGRLREGTECPPGGCADGRPVYQPLFCISEPGKRQTCPVADAISIPEFVVELPGSKGCSLNNTYSVSRTRVWVQNGCRARFRVYTLPNPGLANRNELKLLKELDRTGIFDTKKLQELKTSIEAESAMALSRIRNRLNEYLQARTVGKNNQAEDNLETRLSRIGQKRTQELIHFEELESCDDLRKYLVSKDIYSGFSGAYYFYSSTGQKNHNPIVYKKQITYRVTAEPQFCDFTQLLERSDSSVAQRNDGYNANLNLSRMKEMYSRSTGLSQTQTPNRFVVKASEFNSCPNGRIARCIAKQFVKYSDEGPYSFIDTSHFGEKMYEVNGLRFCFNTNEEFKFDYKKLVHGYLCIPSWRDDLRPKTFDQFVSVKLGDKPIDSRGLNELRTIGCLSKQQASNHFTRNDRAVLVGDDLRGVSRNIRTRIVDGQKKFYCLPNNMTSPQFIDDHLVAAYLLPNPDGSNKQSAVDVIDPFATSRDCAITNGKGIQRRQLDGPWGACTLISCDNGFNRFGNACFPNR